jgi:hypothetical protein
MATEPATETIYLQSNYWELYPRREEISLQAIQQVSEGLAVRLSLKSSLRDLSHYIVSQNEEDAQESPDGEIMVRFLGLGDAKPQLITTEIQAVSASGEKTKSHRVVISYHPKEFYAASGQTSQSWVTIQYTDLALERSTVEDWILDTPSEADRAYAEEHWGKLIKAYESDYEQAQALAKTIMTDLQPHGGVPSDSMRAALPFEQYKRAISGKDKVWCGNHAAIFFWACNSLGIPARRIGMNHPYGTDGDHTLQIAEGHSTTEIFSKTLNRWVWIDLTFNVLGVCLEDQDPINMAELYQFLNDGSRIKALTVVEFDPVTKQETRVPLAESSKKLALFHYYKRDQQFRYTRRAQEG